MTIPMLDLVRQYHAIRGEIDGAIGDVLKSGEFILGPHVRRFEDAAAAYCGVKHAIGLASGTDALLLSLRALGIGPGDAVLVPSFTFFATAGTVHNIGATPVFCDIDPKTYNIDPRSARAIVETHASRACSSWHVDRGKARRSERADQPSPQATSHEPRAAVAPHATSHEPRAAVAPQATSHEPRAADQPPIRAIIPVHLYGQMADMDEIMQLADEYDLAVIEDAAQAIGAQYVSENRHVACSSWPVGKAERQHVARSSLPVGATGTDATDMVLPQATSHEPRAAVAGSIGAIGCFSFYPTKNLGAYGDAGMVTTNDDALAETIGLLRVHGAKPKYFHKMVGVNSRLDAIQAAILDVKLRHLDDWSNARRRIADRYDRLLSDVSGIVTPFRAGDRTHIFHQYTIRVLGGKRDALQAHLRAQGIGTLIYYPRPLHLQECFAHLGYREGQFPHSEDASREVLSLPIFPELTETEQDAVVAAIREFGEKRS